MKRNRNMKPANIDALSQLRTPRRRRIEDALARRTKRLAKSCKLCDRSDKLYVKINELCLDAERRFANGKSRHKFDPFRRKIGKLWYEAAKLRSEADNLWSAADRSLLTALLAAKEAGYPA
jgi:hypothetical protein